MASNSGFIDLRVSSSARGSGDDSVWPSFTDIMTVIVMIFLMALVVMMVRNLELDRRLVTTLSAQEASFRENQGLLERVGALELQVVGLQRSLGASESERDALSGQLAAAQTENQSLGQQLAALGAEFSALEQRTSGEIETLTTANLALTEQVAEQARLAAEQLAAAQAENESLDRRIEELLARNLELEQQRTRAEGQIAELTASEAELGEQISTLSAEFSALELRSGSEIESLSAANLTLSEQLDAVSTQLQQVQVLLQAEQQQRRELAVRVEEQDEELSAKQALLARLELIRRQSAERHEDASAEIEKLNELIRRRQAENDALQELADASGAKYRTLQDEYEALDAKYRNLARPARNSAGKHVVVVRVTKVGVGYRFQLQEPSQDTPVNYTQAELHRRLESLKAELGSELYTRVVIPENSRLSHDEAWRFTQEILQGYDYYYQQYPQALGGSGEAQ